MHASIHTHTHIHNQRGSIVRIISLKVTITKLLSQSKFVIFQCFFFFFFFTWNEETKDILTQLKAKAKGTATTKKLITEENPPIRDYDSNPSALSDWQICHMTSGITSLAISLDNWIVFLCLKERFYPQSLCHQSLLYGPSKDIEFLAEISLWNPSTWMRIQGETIKKTQELTSFHKFEFPTKIKDTITSKSPPWTTRRRSTR